MSYIAANDNRLYTSLESEYGHIPAIEEKNRIPAIRLAVKQTSELISRRDKTGTRTFAGIPAGTRRNTSFDLAAYLSTWSDQTEAPGYSALFQAALGATPQLYSGGVVASASGNRLTFQGSHSLASGQAVAVAGEMRFVTAVVDASTVELNAPFSTTPAAGTEAGPTLTYRPGKAPGSVSIFDYWSPNSAVQRVIRGAAVDALTIKVNGDFHEFQFAGPACDVSDSESFTDGEGGVVEFPVEPASLAFDYGVVPGHMGQVWLGVAPERFYTLTSAEVKVKNNIEARAREFGSQAIRNVVPGNRDVLVDFELYAADDEQTRALYEAARQRSPIRTMFQLGEQQGRLFGVYMKSLTPELPDFDDSETRLLWRFAQCRAQGSGEDEIVVAFG